VHKIRGSFDFIILDEAHSNISSTGRPSKTWKAVAKFTRPNKPILYLSATPYAEHLGLIYHQLKLSSWSPFKSKNFYDWFRQYGVPHMTRTPYGLVETYTKYQDKKILDILKPYFNFKTRAEVGIEHEPSVNLITIPLKDETKKVMENIIKHEMLEVDNLVIPLDSPMKLRTAHYQIEGGTIKDGDTSHRLSVGLEKLDYIALNYDESKIAIMAHFIEERKALQDLFPKARILSSDGHAEGVDLSGVDKLIIYSMSFKTSKHQQRLARQANHDRKTPIIVDVLVCDKPAIGKAVYETVAVKRENFIKNSYEQSI
jgi:hypothetical protein